MSNLKTVFTSKLTRIARSTAKNGRLIYTASFEDGSEHVVRTSNRDYATVAQVKLGCWERTADGKDYTITAGPATEFLFSTKGVPSMREFQRNNVVAVVPVTQA